MPKVGLRRIAVVYGGRSSDSNRLLAAIHRGRLKAVDEAAAPVRYGITEPRCDLLRGTISAIVDHDQLALRWLGDGLKG